MDREWEFQGLFLLKLSDEGGRGQEGKCADGAAGSGAQVQGGCFREGYPLGLFLGEGEQGALEAQLKTH